jgi:hypothetical protein
MIVEEQGSRSDRARDQDEFEVAGAAAKAHWREVRPLFAAAAVITCVVLLLSWLLWHRTLVQLGWIGLSCSSFTLAAMVWRYNLLGFSYDKSSGPGGGRSSFTGKRPPVPRELAAPALVLGGIVLFVAGTETGVGRWLSSALEKAKTLHDAGAGVVGFIVLPIGVLVLLVVVGAGIALLGSGIFRFAKFVVSKLRGKVTEDAGLGELGMGALMLTGLASAIYMIVINWTLVVGEALKPYKTIWGWFS